ncbi:MAG: hypothetical protein WCW52_10335 [Elusimicrobiales bacterium]
MKRIIVTTVAMLCLAGGAYAETAVQQLLTVAVTETIIESPAAAPDQVKQPIVPQQPPCFLEALGVAQKAIDKEAQTVGLEPKGIILVETMKFQFAGPSSLEFSFNGVIGRGQYNVALTMNPTCDLKGPVKVINLAK